MPPRCALMTLLLLTTIGSVVSGCAGGANVEALEARLRVSQDRLVETERVLAEARDEIELLRTDMAALRESAAGRGRPLAAGPRPKSLAFSGLLTGGVDENGNPGDEAIRAVIQPVLEDGSPVRAEGRLELELLDVSAPADRRVRGAWSFAGKELRELWTSGLFSTGFETTLSLNDEPLPDGALLLARFVTPEGDQLDATTSLKLNPEPSARSTSAAAVQQVSVPRDVSRNVVHADVPPEFPVREPPADNVPPSGESNPFERFLESARKDASSTVNARRLSRGRGGEQTSDVWNDTSIPVLR